MIGEVEMQGPSKRTCVSRSGGGWILLRCEPRVNRLADLTRRRYE